eukprot:CAMPEP_0185025370 /NCGR_PEP_ID=MMETSP1103-20130426/8354_1 /TAXON_ID=36769 /ORGANISM="Paraphysomonas bandaiensis, Strain Caron Lab Isolate" /LENGTH=924 /DNA_ID=CAMNT_0027558559 /DNA_START=154 /DNA_END=2928 /DNA_ORIENTATION=+
MRPSITCVLVSLAIGFVASEVTIAPQVQTIYDRAPKLRIKGVGFDADEHDISIEISATGEDPLKMDKDFILSKSDDGIILKLLTSRKWVDLTTRNPPVGLILSSVKFKSSGDRNLLPSPMIVANVLATPSIKENTEVIYKTATNELEIEGSGFTGAKKIDLYFDPPLFKEIAYEVVSPFPLSGNSVTLRLRHNYEWAENPGKLSVIGVDTGGGPVKLNGEVGVVVATVEDNLDAHFVKVEDTESEQVIYHDDPSVKIKGSGFNPDETTLRFNNGLLGKGVNYTITSLSENSMTLRLTPGSLWRKNVENLPGYLTLLAVNAGEGFVAVGPTNAGKGRDVARVFERPNVFSSFTKIYRTHSHELHIRGVGFPIVMSTPQLKFNPPLTEGRDYTIRVVDRTNIEVNLKDGREWASGPCELLVTDINTRGDEAGWVKLPGEGVHVAQVVDDVDSEYTGGVEVYPMTQRVYQSVLHSKIDVTGTGFTNGISFMFSPSLAEGVDYTTTYVSRNKVQLNLKSGKKWAQEPNMLVVKAVKVDGKDYPLANGDGIRIATILEDPVVESGDDNIHETQSKVVVISGRGFTNVADVKVVLRPTVPGAYKVLSVSDDTIRLQLKPDYDWLPSFLTLADSDKKYPLQVSSVDTGAGDIVFDSPITIGNIVKDREGVVCDDSCEFAFDGVCDDGTEDEMYYNYYDGFGYYMDDDFGGYYGYGQYADGEAYDDEVVYWYDDYYMEDDQMMVSACLKGTDCTDCGGVDAIVDYSNIDSSDTNAVVCTNTCPYARDGQCDDPRGANYCILGTDCQDCGRVGADNFTIVDDDGWWEDDDDYWTFNDGVFLDQAKGLEANRPRVKVVHTESAGAAAVFLTMLEGMVYTIGAIFAAAALYVLSRWYKGQSIPFMQVFTPESSAVADLEMQPARRMPITPDVIRT